MKEYWKMSPNYSVRPNGLDDVWGVILHHTGTGGDTGKAVADFFATPASRVSAHVTIDEVGDVWHSVSIDKAAWHAGQCKRYDWDRDGKLEDWEQWVNAHTIGIELCNKGDNKDTFPNNQIRSAAKLIRRWDKKCPHLDLRTITDHQAVNLNGKIDLRPNFPAAKLFWWILHPYRNPPNDVYAQLPKWAQRRVDEIKK